MMKHILRYILFLAPMIWCYIMFLVFFFWGTIPFFPKYWLLFILISLLLWFLLFLNLSFPDIALLWIYQWQIFFLITFISLMIVIWWPILFKDYNAFFTKFGFQLLSWIVLLIWIFILLQIKQSSLENKITMQYRTLQYAWVFIFSFFVATFVAIYSYWSFRSIPFSCEDIQESQDWFIDMVLSPIRYGNDVFNILEENIRNFLITDVQVALEWFVDIDFTKEESPTLFRKIKNTVIMETLEEKRVVDWSICEFMMSLVSEKVKNPWFQYSAIMLMILLLYPFVSITFFLMVVVSYLLFMVLYYTKFWTKHTMSKDVEYLE